MQWLINAGPPLEGACGRQGNGLQDGWGVSSRAGLPEFSALLPGVADIAAAATST